MRRHRSTKSRSTLTRSKSTASICSAIQRLEHIAPATAERDAHIAANLSFSRAGLSHDPEMAAWFSQHHNNYANMETWLEGPADSGRPQNEPVNHDYEEDGLRRQQSVRFVKQGSLPKRPQGQSNEDSSDLSTIRRRSIPNDMGNRPLSQASSKEERQLASTYTANYIDSLPPIESFRPLDEFSPTPVLYRKLRKSRSMFSPSNPVLTTKPYFDDSAEQSNAQPALRRQSMRNIKENKPTLKTLGLRAPKSTSFLNIRNAISVSRASIRQQNDLAVQEAENSFRRDVEDQRHLKSSPSTFFSKKKKSQSSLGLRKSMRDFSSGAQFAGSDHHLTVRKDASLRNKARKVSKSLKTKLKEIFKRSRKDDPTTLTEETEPVDMIGDGGFDTEQDDPYMDTVNPITDECSILQVPSRVPSLHNAVSAQRLCSRQGSIESIQSERKVSDEKSRVTSWTSSGTHTLNSQSTWVSERDRQRLSVIKENGPHHSSSSFGSFSMGDRNPYEFEPLSPHLLGEPARPAQLVDSARVYSALMNRLNEVKQRKQQVVGLRQSSNSDSGSEIQGPSHLWTFNNGQTAEEVTGQSPPTIRCVLQEDDLFRDSPWDQGSQSVIGNETINLINDNVPPSTGSVVRHRQQPGSEITLASFKTHQPPIAGDEQGFSPPRSFKTHSEDVTIAPKILSTRSSAFVSSPTCHLFRTSQYREALQALIKEDTPAPSEFRSSSTTSSLNLDVIPTKRRPSLSKEDPRLAYSGSVYSDELLSPQSIPQIMSEQIGPTVPPRHPSHRAPDMHAHKAYSASVCSDSVIKRDQEGTPPASAQNDTVRANGAQIGPMTYTPMIPADRAVSNASSVEWKTWLSANASKTDVNLANARARDLSKILYSKPSLPSGLGHVREGAEIEESQFPTSGTENTRLQTPLRTMSHNPRQASSASRVELGTKTPTSMMPSRDENAAPSSYGRIAKHLNNIHDPPPIPPRNSLRTTPSMPLMQPRSSQGSILVKSAERKALNVRSLDTISNCQPGDGSPRPKSRSPVKLVRKNGPRKGLAMAVENRFGPTLANEQSNRVSHRVRGDSTRCLRDYDDSESAGESFTTSLDGWTAQAGGKHQMFEEFLSSRNRASASGAVSRAFL